MIYKSITIRNYKGIDNVTIDFSNRILTLVGLNESGKTTILQAISLLYDITQGEKLNVQQANDIRPKGIGFDGNICLMAELELDDEDLLELKKYTDGENKKLNLQLSKQFTYQVDITYNMGRFAGQKENITFDIISDKKNKPAVEVEKNKLIEKIKSEYIPEILYYEDFIFEIPESIRYNFDVDDSEDEDYTNYEWRLVLNDILKNVDKKFQSFKEDVVDIWEEDKQLARHRILEMESKLDKIITSAWKKLHTEESVGQKKTQQLNFKEIKITQVAQDDDGVSFSFTVKTENNKEFSINERSKGCKWFFSFLIFTEFRKKRSKNILFLLDEPASNLHSAAQLKILDALESLSDSSIIMYSTHSHHLINPKWLNGAYVVINEGISDEDLKGRITDSEAKITVEKYYNYASKYSQESQTIYFQPILDRLDYKPSLLEPIPNIVICEGKSDWVAFKYISEIILGNRYSFNFYPGKGKDNNGDIIRLYLSWGANFIVILDGDIPSQKAKKQYKKEFDSFLDNKIFTLDEIINEDIALEKMFTEKDIETIINQAFLSDPSLKKQIPIDKQKSRLHLAINNLYCSKTPVPLEKKTISKFETLFNFILSQQQ